MESQLKLPKQTYITEILHIAVLIQMILAIRKSNFKKILKTS